MTPGSEEQVDRARRLLDYVEEEDGVTVRVIDFLDALASTGLRIEKDDMGISTQAYMELLTGARTEG